MFVGKQDINEKKAEEEFVCCHCGRRVSLSKNKNIGTAHRNHCPYCLFSRHLDKEISGDRAAGCGGCMRAIGLTFKREGRDKYGRERKGELMIIHECVVCGDISINRLAADDEEKAILSLFNESLSLNEKTKNKLVNKGIDLIGIEDKKDVFIKLFGKGIGNI